MQVVIPTPLYFPEGQMPVHALVAPVLAPKRPAAHGSHDGFPIELWNWPAGQLEQLDASVQESNIVRMWCVATC